MGTNILGIGQSALMAAQAGLATTGHNIANAATPGYNRQIVIQSSAGGQNQGFGFVGSGAFVSDVRRVYNEYLAGQVSATKSSASQLETYYGQISQINNQFADTAAGISPTLQSFFAGVQALAADPNSSASRESMLSSAQALAARFQGMSGQLSEMQNGVNNQITATIGSINAYASQISNLNEAIAKAMVGSEHLPNDLLDQRDQVIADLSKQVQVSVVKQDSAYNVFIGNGQPLVVGTSVFEMAPTASPNDLSRIEIGYSSNGNVQMLPESAFAGGVLGGLFEFRAKSLDLAQNALGRVAVGLALTFNAQHELGQDQRGALGTAFFNAADPLVQPNANNQSAATLSATITNANGLTTSDYRMQFDGANYRVTRLSDQAVLYNNTTFPTAEIDGLTFAVSGAMSPGDDFIIRPTVNGASGFSVALTETSQIAAAAPLRTAAASANTGTGKIGAAVSDSVAVTPSLTLTYAAGNLTGFPADLPVTVTHLGVATTIPAGSPVPYFAGDTLSFGGVTVTGIPAAAGSYTVAPTSTITYNSTPGAAPSVTPNAANTGTLSLGASVANPSALVASDYRIDYDAGAATYSITRLSDNTVVYPPSAALPAGPIDGLNFSNLGGVAPAAGTDSFLVQQKTLTGFPPYLPVTVTRNGVSTTYAPGAPVSYVEGATVSYGGVSFTMSGTPNNGDSFSVSRNTSGVGDNRNAVLLGALQQAKTLGLGTTSFQGAYAQMVSSIGNKAAELKITSAAESALHNQTLQRQQSESGVNLDEEATNLLRYQQAYEAAGKLMQTASKLFDLLLSLGG